MLFCFFSLWNNRNLGHNHFPAFPPVGLENVLHIKVHNNPNLREFPTPASFPRVKTLALSYAYHCCPFQRPTAPSPFAIGDGSLSDSIIFPSNEHGIDLTAWAKGEAVWVDSSNDYAPALCHFSSFTLLINNNFLFLFFFSYHSRPTAAGEREPAVGQHGRSQLVRSGH